MTAWNDLVGNLYVKSADRELGFLIMRHITEELERLLKTRCHIDNCQSPAIQPGPGEAVVCCAVHMGQHDANNCVPCGTASAPEAGVDR